MRLVFFAATKTKRRGLLLSLLLMVLPAAGWVLHTNHPVSSPSAVLSMPLTGRTIVIDPGHGGYDPGVVRGDTEEKQIALGISLALRNYLQSAGARVVMTRETDRDLLLVPAAGPKKHQDMQNRMLVINGAGADLLVSIHVNSIGSSIWHGAQVFYQDGDERSKILAGTVQQELARVLANTDRVIKPGNYYVLREAEASGILVECGFLSNPREAELLSDPDYQSKVAWAVYLGLLRHFSQ